MRNALLALLLTLAANAAPAATNITGVVVDSASKPVADAHVYVYTASPKIGTSSLCPSCYRDCGKQEPVDAQGRFTLQSLDPTLLFKILAVAPGYEGAFARNVDPASGEVTIRLTRRAEDAERLIVGSVVDPNGKPIVGAVVEPRGYRPDDELVGYGAIPGVGELSITDTKGEFALVIPDAKGKLDVRVTARSFAPRFERMLAPGQPRQIRLAEGPAISGRVVKNGRPVAGARVAFVQRNRASFGFLGRVEIGTNEDGRFVMTNLAREEMYVVYVPMTTFADSVVAPKLVTTHWDDGVVDAGDLAVVPGRSIRGAVVVPESAPIPRGSRVLLYYDLADDVSEAEVQKDGSFVFDPAPTDAVKLTVRIPALGLQDSVPVPAGGDVSNLCVELGER